jgi:hypothetical protein
MKMPDLNDMFFGLFVTLTLMVILLGCLCGLKLLYNVVLFVLSCFFDISFNDWFWDWSMV